MTCATVAHAAARISRRLVPVVAALAFVATAAQLGAQPAQASPGKVVIVVGPTGSATAHYLDQARSYAAQARAAGAAVSEIYTPNATWSRVVSASRGANMLIYLGHGNGWPSPYPPFQTQTKDGMGLNAYLGSGNVTPKYYGEAYIAASIRLAPNAVVLLNHLCYAAGAGEEGSANPSWDVARQRVDNYAAGFLRTGATSVLADRNSSLTSELGALFAGRGVLTAWRADPDANGHERAFASSRTSGATVRLDPNYASSGFYRSLVTRSTVVAAVAPAPAPVAAPALVAKPTTSLVLRSRPSTTATRLAVLATGTSLRVTGPLLADAAGRTWTPVATSSGTKGYVAGWYAKFSGSARARVNVNLRMQPSTASTAQLTISAGTRVTVTASTADSGHRVWFAVRTSTGRTGWVAGWLMQP